MQQLRRIIQLLQNGLSERAVSRQAGIARKTVREYKTRLKNIAQDYTGLLSLNDEDLHALLFEDIQDKKLTNQRFLALQEQFSLLSGELQRTGVTKELLWNEYKTKHPGGYNYSQFCFHFQQYLANKNTVMHFMHVPGAKAEFDFAGKTLSYINPDGVLNKCQVYVSVLPYSGYTYIEAVESQRQYDFLECFQNSLKFYGGVPKTMVGDNFKSCVKRADRYEPEFPDLINQVCLHYNTAMLPARVRKPRDKGTVEKSVDLAYQRVYAPLRNKQFFSLRELNVAISEQLEKHNKKKFRKGDLSRKELFEQYEKQTLAPLPDHELVIKRKVSAKVQKNYHVVLGEDWHFYSVPYQYVGKASTIIYTKYGLEIYCDHKRIAVHTRNVRRNGYTTLQQHMPANHRHYAETLGWDTDYFLNWAKGKAPEVLQVIERLLQSRLVAEQSYRACMGILMLEKKYTRERLVTACAMALQANAVSYKIINGILKTNRDKLNQKEQVVEFDRHENIRGAEFYNQ